MSQTVIGIFDSAEEAREAVQQLTSKGFSRESIDLSNTGSTTSPSYSSTSNSSGEGGVTNFFKSLFSDDSDKYANVAKRSQSIVTVHAKTADEAENAADILDDYGAVDIDERAASYGYTGTGSTDKTYASTGTTGYTNTNIVSDETTKIPIIEESLEVGKREVLKGGVRLRSRIVERPVEESLRLREENVRVERTSVDRAATSADLDNFKATEISMTEKAEVPVVAKEARVVEEVSLGKDVSERTETVSDTVRKTEVDVENFDKTTDTTKTGYTSNTGSSSAL